MNCWNCAKAIDPSDRYCRFCGEGQGEHVAWYYHPLAIGFLAVFLMGPFAIALALRTPRLSRQGRWIATGLILLYTLYLCYSFVAALRMLRSTLLGAF